MAFNAVSTTMKSPLIKKGLRSAASFISKNKFTLPMLSATGLMGHEMSFVSKNMFDDVGGKEDMWNMNEQTSKIPSSSKYTGIEKHYTDGNNRTGAGRFRSSPMRKITSDVEFNTLAREWRCKWSDDADKASLSAVQKVVSSYRHSLKNISGMKKIQRIVCGDCKDFKVITSVHSKQFQDWENAKFAPEAELIEKLKAIDGVSDVETQTFTLMDV